MGVLHSYGTWISLPVKSLWPPPSSPPVPLSVAEALGVPEVLGVPVGVWEALSVGSGDVLVELPSPAATLMVAAGFTVSVGAHFVSVEKALMVYASGVSVTSPGFV